MTEWEKADWVADVMETSTKEELLRAFRKLKDETDRHDGIGDIIDIVVEKEAERRIHEFYRKNGFRFCPDCGKRLS